MDKIIKIKKGLNINLVGEAEHVVEHHEPQYCAIKPTDFIGIYPKLHVEEGDKVKAGSILFHDKYREDLFFTSPTSGTIKAIIRGEKRLLKEIIIETDGRDDKIDFGKGDPLRMSREEITSKLVQSGIWAMIRQRPYSIIANPSDKPKCIVVSTFDTAPLAPDNTLIIKNKQNIFQKGIDVLTRLTDGKVHLNVRHGDNSDIFTNIKGVNINYFTGPHPAGNVSTQINRLDPINKGEIIWYCYPQDILTIGELFETGYYNGERVFALTGSEVLHPHYYQSIIGTCISDLVNNNTGDKENRYISGNVLTGKKIDKDGFISFYDNAVTVIPEGRHHELFGWLAPNLKKFSFSHTFLSYLFPKRKYVLDTNMHGGVRPYIMTGEFEKIFPFDIFPLQLIKACIIKDIDLMENLGIYEVDEEDFALCEVIDPSKTPIQKIIREGIDLIHKEMN